MNFQEENSCLLDIEKCDCECESEEKEAGVLALALFSVPRPDKSCNLLSVLHRDYSYGIFCNFFCQLLLKDELHSKCDKVLV
jgi:hypothetical protein